MATGLEIVVECTDLDAMVEFCTSTAALGCRIELITPADDPAEYVVSRHGVRLRLIRSDVDRPVSLRLDVEDDIVDGERWLVAPNGSVVELVSSSAASSVPDNVASLSVVRADGDDSFGAGRAGMGYRDLLPDRWGGRFIASHILIEEGGDVADYVHFHRIRFQMIFVAAGWVDVVYENQGEPFRMFAGDCVLQPPEIRHRVLRSSPGLEVVEIGCPAEHDTLVEHDIDLPTVRLDPDRDFGGQRFVRHVAADWAGTERESDGFVHRDTGIAAATDGLADARVLGMTNEAIDESDIGVESSPTLTHDGEFAMFVVVAGSARIDVEAGPGQDAQAFAIMPRDAVAVPAGARWSWSERSPDLEILQVTLPAQCVTLR